MGADPNIHINPTGVRNAASVLDGVRSSMAIEYAEFGGRTGFDIGQNPITILGTRDAMGDVLSSGFVAAGPDVTTAWKTFCTEWGAFIDEAVGVVVAMTDALNQAADIYSGSDADAAARLQTADGPAKALAASQGDLGTFAHGALGTNPGFVPTAPDRTSTADGETGRFDWITKKPPFTGAGQP